MRLETKLDMALKGVNANDLAAVFTYVWNRIGFPIKEEDVRKVLPITENIGKFIDVDNVLKFISERVNIKEARPEDIRRILTQLKFKGDVKNKLAKIIINVLSRRDDTLISLINTPDEYRTSNEDPFASLERVPKLKNTSKSNVRTTVRNRSGQGKKDDKSGIESGETVAMRKYDDEGNEDWDSEAIEYGESEVMR
jgi:hypothetical protein